MAHHPEKFVRQRREAINGGGRRAGVLCDCSVTSARSARLPFTLVRSSETHHPRRATRRLASPGLPSRLLARSRGRTRAASAADRVRRRPSRQQERVCEEDGEKFAVEVGRSHQRIATWHRRSVRPVAKRRRPVDAFSACITPREHLAHLEARTAFERGQSNRISPLQGKRGEERGEAHRQREGKTETRKHFALRWVVTIRRGAGWS